MTATPGGLVDGYSRAERVIDGAGHQPRCAGGDAVPDLVMIPLVFQDQ
ncbi:MAG TPA: hypothetical protein VFQ77_12475 [Pseudonocardiaceae bacterium]|nr:hypothetical protein [Pseudonocardiaceae bacterium]